MYNLADCEVCAESVLLNHEGVEDKDLVKLVNNDPNNANDDDNDDEMDTMSNYHIFCLTVYQTN